MLKVVTLSLVLAGLCFSSVSFAQSADVEATISRVDTEKLTIVLDDGKVVGQGTHQELLDTCDVYRQIAESQLSQSELTA